MRAGRGGRGPGRGAGQPRAGARFRPRMAVPGRGGGVAPWGPGRRHSLHAHHPLQIKPSARRKPVCGCLLPCLPLNLRSVGGSRTRICSCFAMAPEADAIGETAQSGGAPAAAAACWLAGDDGGDGSAELYAGVSSRLPHPDACRYEAGCWAARWFSSSGSHN